MITESKKDNQSAYTNLTTTIDQQTFPRSNTCDEEIDDTLIVGKGKSKNAYTQADYNYVANVQSIFIDDAKQSKNTFEHDNQLTMPFSLYRLPNEIIKFICRQLFEDKETLYQCCLVNKHFYAIANPLLWKNPFFGLYFGPECYSGFEKRFLTCLLQAHSLNSQYIRYFYLRGYCWNHTDLALLIPHVHHLEELEIGDFDESSPKDAIQYLPRYCHHLTTLSISETNLGRAFFSSLGQHCHQLRRLGFDFCSFLSPDTFELLADCPLEEFSFFSTNPDDEMAFLNEKTLADFGKFDTLTALQFNAPSGRAVSRILEMTRTLVWPRLTKLDLRNCYDMNDASFVPFIKSHPFLEVVFLTHAAISDVSLNVLSVCLPSLTSVFFCECPNISLAGVLGLIQHVRQLDLLVLASCGTILASDFPENDKHAAERIHLNRLALDKIKARLNFEQNQEPSENETVGVIAESKLTM